jgi:xanthine dehydrogenase small subunit
VCFFLALDSSLLLNHNGQKRTIKLRDFYKGYKQLDKNADEFIEQISFKKPKSNTLFNFEKVCKRTHLDIASVNTACQMSLDDTNTITQIHLSAGGVAPFPKYLHNTVTYLTGKKIDEPTLQKAIEIMQTEVAPISDVRGSSHYKRLLLQQLFKAHFLSIVSCKL